MNKKRIFSTLVSIFLIILFFSLSITSYIEKNKNENAITEVKYVNKTDFTTDYLIAKKFVEENHNKTFSKSDLNSLNIPVKDYDIIETNQTVTKNLLIFSPDKVYKKRYQVRLGDFYKKINDIEKSGITENDKDYVTIEKKDSYIKYSFQGFQTLFEIKIFNDGRQTQYLKYDIVEIIN